MNTLESYRIAVRFHELVEATNRAANLYASGRIGRETFVTRESALQAEIDRMVKVVRGVS